MRSRRRAAGSGKRVAAGGTVGRAGAGALLAGAAAVGRRGRGGGRRRRGERGGGRAAPHPGPAELSTPQDVPRYAYYRQDQQYHQALMQQVAVEGGDDGRVIVAQAVAHTGHGR